MIAMEENIQSRKNNIVWKRERGIKASKPIKPMPEKNSIWVYEGAIYPIRLLLHALSG